MHALEDVLYNEELHPNSVFWYTWMMEHYIQ